MHVPDIERDPEYKPHPLIRAAGFRSALSVPMLHDDAPIGAITVWRADVGPFGDKQISLKSAGPLVLMPVLSAHLKCGAAGAAVTKALFPELELRGATQLGKESHDGKHPFSL